MMWNSGNVSLIALSLSSIDCSPKFVIEEAFLGEDPSSRIYRHTRGISLI